MTEGDVALTDFALALQSAWFARCFWRLAPGGRLRRSLQALFGGLALAALTGGLWHGFLTAPSTLSDRVWWLTMACAGIAAGGYALLGLALWRAPPAAGFAVTALVALYSATALRWPDFRLTVAIVIPATLACASGLWHRRQLPGAPLALAGTTLGLLAAIPQQLGWELPALQLTHNAVYHLLLLAAHLLLYRGLRRLLAAGPENPS